MKTQDSLWGSDADLERRVTAQIRAWEQRQAEIEAEKPKPRPFLTISRQFGAQGFELGQYVARRLTEVDKEGEWLAHDKDVLEKVAADHHLPRSVLESLCDRRRTEVASWIKQFFGGVTETTAFRKLAETIRAMALGGHTVLIGRGAGLITRDLPDGLHVRVVAPKEWRADRLRARRELGEAEALKLIDERDALRAEFVRTYLKQEIEDPYIYDMVLNNARLSLEQMGELLVGELIREKIPAAG